MPFPLSDEPKIEARQEQNEVDDGTQAADLRRLGKARAQDRHRHAGQPEIEKDPRVHEEGPGKELTNVLPWNPAKQSSLEAHRGPVFGARGSTVSGRQCRRTIDARPALVLVTNSADVPLVARLTLCCGVWPVSHCRTYSPIPATHAARSG